MATLGRSAKQPGVIFLFLFLFVLVVGVMVYGQSCEHAFLQGSATCGLCAKFHLPSTFVNKVVLERSRVHWSVYHPWVR